MKQKLRNWEKGGGWVGGAGKTEARKQHRAEQAIGERTEARLGREGWGWAALIFPFKRKKRRGETAG